MIPSLDISAILEELNRGELFVFSLYELGILTETETTDLLQIIQEEPKTLHIFVGFASPSNLRVADSSFYKEFIRQHPCSSTRAHSLYSETYPAQEITSVLLALEKKERLTRTEYALLYRRCMSNSIVLEHCYATYLKEKDEDAFVANIHTAIAFYDLLKGNHQIENEAHTKLIEYLMDNHLLSEEELQWLLQEYANGNEVLLNSFDVCCETHDVDGFVALFRNLMNMICVYQRNSEVQEFLTVLIKEMASSGVLSEEQTSRLDGLLQEPDECLCGLYEEYCRSGDFEGLVSALMVMGDGVSAEENGETVVEEEMKLPSKEDATAVIESMRGALCDEAIERLLALLGGGDVDIVYEVRERREA